MLELSETIERKFIDSIDIDEWEIETDSGWQNITAIHKTIEYQEWKIETDSGLKLVAADDHILFDENMNQIFLKDCITGVTKIATKTGFELITSVNKADTYSNMFDLTVNSDDHRYYTNGILSHNTSMIGAIVFALYGKPYGKDTKPQLVNSITKKNMLCEIDFSIGEIEYTIRRGAAPNLFEIYQNGSLIEPPSDLKEYQELLEKTILKINYKSFCQVVVLGSTNYVPFMKLPAGDRRAVVEDLLDIQVFTKMNSILKQKIDENKQEVAKNKTEITLLEQKIELYNKHIVSLQENNDDIIEDKLKGIRGLKHTIAAYEKQNEESIEKIEDLTKEVKDTTRLTNTKDQLLQFQYKFDDKIAAAGKEILFFAKNNHCPTCKQEIDVTFKETEIEKKTVSVAETQVALLKLEEKLKETKLKLDEANKVNNEISSINSDIKSNTLLIRNYQASIETMCEEIDSIKNKSKVTTQNNSEIDDLVVSLNKKMSYKYTLESEKELFDVSHHLLKDTGIKTKIIGQYIPIINQQVNKYLSDLDFFVNFELDDKFGETIKSRNRDDFTFSSFSEGEKMRLNLALLFSWRAIAKMRNSASTNLLIMDEVADSSLDEEGTSGFLHIIENLGPETNVFLISHHGDSIYDKFHSVIKMEKVNNFSRIAVNAL